MNPSLTEIDQFIKAKSLVFGLVNTPIGEVYALVSGVINNNNHEDALMLDRALRVFNGDWG